MLEFAPEGFVEIKNRFDENYEGIQKSYFINPNFSFIENKNFQEKIEIFFFRIGGSKCDTGVSISVETFGQSFGYKRENYFWCPKFIFQERGKNFYNFYQNFLNKEKFFLTIKQLFYDHIYHIYDQTKI